MIIPIFYFFRLLRKQDVYGFLIWRNRILGIISLAMVGVLLLIYFTTNSKMISMYKSFNLETPIALEYSWIGVGLITVFFSLIGAKFLINKPNKSKLESKLSKYKDDEYISPMQIEGPKYEILIWVLFGLAVGWIVTTTIVPIYELTASF